MIYGMASQDMTSNPGMWRKMQSHDNNFHLQDNPPFSQFLGFS